MNMTNMLYQNKIMYHVIREVRMAEVITKGSML